MIEPVSVQAIFPSIVKGDIDAIQRLLDGDAGLVHSRLPDPNFRYFTALQFAAAKGQLAICKLLVERGAEVYPNPMNSYPPVIHAAWNGHQEIVDYFLREIPERAEGTNKLGVAINLAARQGWLDIVRKHIAADPLSVHQRGWIGDTPLHWPAHEGFVEILEAFRSAEPRSLGGRALRFFVIIFGGKSRSSGIPRPACAGRGFLSSPAPGCPRSRNRRRCPSDARCCS